MKTYTDWAEAIAYRIVDEHPISSDFPEDAKLLRIVLEELLSKNKAAVRQLIGTGIIEENYFEQLN